MNLYADKAVHVATEAGLLPCEIDALLDGHPVTAFVPPRSGEPLKTYADRATSELFVRYLVEGATAGTPASEASR